MEQTVKTGWVIIIPERKKGAYCVIGQSLHLYASEREALMDIADTLMGQLDAFFDGTIEWTEIDFCQELEVRFAVRNSDGSTIVFEDADRNVRGVMEYMHIPQTNQLMDFRTIQLTS